MPCYTRKLLFIACRYSDPVTINGLEPAKCGAKGWKSNQVTHFDFFHFIFFQGAKLNRPLACKLSFSFREIQNSGAFQVRALLIPRTLTSSTISIMLEEGTSILWFCYFTFSFFFLSLTRPAREASSGFLGNTVVFLLIYQRYYVFILEYQIYLYLIPKRVTKSLTLKLNM